MFAGSMFAPHHESSFDFTSQDRQLAAVEQRYECSVPGNLASLAPEYQTISDVLKKRGRLGSCKSILCLYIQKERFHCLQQNEDSTRILGKHNHPINSLQCQLCGKGAVLIVPRKQNNMSSCMNSSCIVSSACRERTNMKVCIYVHTLYRCHRRRRASNVRM